MNKTNDPVDTNISFLPDARLSASHSHEFLDAVSQTYADCFGLSREHHGVVLKRPFSKKQVVCNSPLVSHSLPIPMDESIKRSIIFEKSIANRPVKFGSPVLSRLELSNEEHFELERIPSKCRNLVRKSSVKGYRFAQLRVSTPEFFEYLRILEQQTRSQGSPCLPDKLMIMLAELAHASTFGVFSDRDQLVAGGTVFRDCDLVWVSWVAAKAEARKYLVNYFLYFKLLKWFSMKAHNSPLIFDFGRSMYGSNSYKFKKQWGTTPVGLNYFFKGRPYDIYHQSLLRLGWQIAPNHFQRLLEHYLPKTIIGY